MLLLGSETHTEAGVELGALACSSPHMYNKDYALSFYGRVASSITDTMRNNEHRNEHQKGNVIVRSFAV